MINPTPGPGTRAIKANEWKPGKTAFQREAERLAASHDINVLWAAIALYYGVSEHELRNKNCAWILLMQAREKRP